MPIRRRRPSPSHPSSAAAAASEKKGNVSWRHRTAPWPSPGPGPGPGPWPSPGPCWSPGPCCPPGCAPCWPPCRRSSADSAQPPPAVLNLMVNNYMAIPVQYTVGPSEVVANNLTLALCYVDLADTLNLHRDNLLQAFQDMKSWGRFLQATFDVLLRKKQEVDEVLKDLERMKADAYPMPEELKYALDLIIGNRGKRAPGVAQMKSY